MSEILDILGLHEIFQGGNYWQIAIVCLVGIILYIINCITGIKSSIQKIQHDDASSNVKMDILTAYSAQNNRLLLEMIRDASIRSHKMNTPLHDELQKDIDRLHENDPSNKNDFGDLPSSS